MNAFQQLAHELWKLVGSKDLKRFEGHAIAVSRLHVHGIISKSEAHRLNAKIVKQIQAVIRK